MLDGRKKMVWEKFSRIRAVKFRPGLNYERTVPKDLSKESEMT